MNVKNLIPDLPENERQAALRAIMRECMHHLAHRSKPDDTDRLTDLMVNLGEFQWPADTTLEELVEFYRQPEGWIEDDSMVAVEFYGIDLEKVDWRRFAEAAHSLAQLGLFDRQKAAAAA